MWLSAFILLAISAFFTIIGGLKAIAYTNVYQMVLLILVSATLTIVGIWHLGGESVIGGINTLADPNIVPSDYWIPIRSFHGFQYCSVIRYQAYGSGVRISRWYSQFLLPGT